LFVDEAFADEQRPPPQGGKHLSSKPAVQVCNFLFYGDVIFRGAEIIIYAHAEARDVHQLSEHLCSLKRLFSASFDKRMQVG
jgi:hypothetical protein